MKVKDLFITKNKDVPFAWIDPDFTEAFGDAQVSDKGQVLIGKRLPRAMTSGEISEELKPDFVSLAELYETLKVLDHDIWGLFYIQSDGVSQLVHVYWHAGNRGWYVCSRPVTYSHQWGAGYQVFSRNFRDTGRLSTSDPLTLGNLESRIAALEDWRAKLTEAWNNPKMENY